MRSNLERNDTVFLEISLVHNSNMKTSTPSLGTNFGIFYSHVSMRRCHAGLCYAAFSPQLVQALKAHKKTTTHSCFLKHQYAWLSSERIPYSHDALVSDENVIQVPATHSGSPAQKVSAVLLIREFDGLYVTERHIVYDHDLHLS